MDLEKMTTNNWIAGGGGVVSLINLFFPWYGADFGIVSVSINAWDAGILAWLGALLAVACGAIIVLKVLDITEVKVGGLLSEQFAMVLGGIGTLFILLKLLVDNDATRFGIFLGLLAAAAATAGAFLSAKDLGIGIPSTDDFKSADE